MNQKIPVPSASGSCPVCHGTGWELYNATVFCYGEPEEVLFARKCEKCSGMRRREDKTGVPDQFRDADIAKFDFGVYGQDLSKLQDLCNSVIRDFAKWRGNGKGIYLWSKTPGSGKTFLACCVAKSVMMANDVQMRFVTAPDYISLVGDSYKRQPGEEDQSEIYRTCDILVLDDIGAQANKEWQQQEMFRLINRRMEEGNVTIYTSNLRPEALNVDDRTIDRIIKTSVVLQMPEVSIRRKKAQGEQEQFLNAVLGGKR